MQGCVVFVAYGSEVEGKIERSMFACGAISSVRIKNMKDVPRTTRL